MSGEGTEKSLCVGVIDSLSSVNTHVQKGHYIYLSFIGKHARPNIEYIKIKNSKAVCCL